MGPLGMSEHQSPPPIVVLPSQQGWEREANSRWDEETGREEERREKRLLGSARKWPFDAEPMRRLPRAQGTGFARSVDRPIGLATYCAGGMFPTGSAAEEIDAVAK